MAKYTFEEVTHGAALDIQEQCLLELDREKPLNGRPHFGWPLDGLSREPWQYFVHCRLVRDWNREDRQTPSDEFHRRWLSNLDNIKAAMKDWYDAIQRGSGRKHRYDCQEQEDAEAPKCACNGRED